MDRLNIGEKFLTKCQNLQQHNTSSFLQHLANFSPQELATFSMRLSNITSVHFGGYRAGYVHRPSTLRLLCRAVDEVGNANNVNNADRFIEVHANALQSNWYEVNPYATEAQNIANFERCADINSMYVNRNNYLVNPYDFQFLPLNVRPSFNSTEFPDIFELDTVVTDMINIMLTI